MALRRDLIESVLGANEYMMTITSFPIMGALSHSTYTAVRSILKHQDAACFHGFDFFSHLMYTGVGDFVAGSSPEAGGQICQSLYIPDSLIGPHPRFATLTRNIRQRRQSKVSHSIMPFSRSTL